MKPRSNPQRHRAFTLGEMLVILGVVVLLSALVIGAVVRGKKQRRHSVEDTRIETCQGQLKRLAQAALQYASDDDGKFPGEEFQSEMYPYIRTRKKIECPTYTATMPEAPWRVGPTHYIFSYMYNGGDLSGRRVDAGAGRGKGLARPAAKTWMFADEFRDGKLRMGYVDYSACEGNHFWPMIHRDGGNYAFADGHVKWMKVEGMESVACREK